MKHTMNKFQAAIGVAFALALLTSSRLGATPPTVTFNLTGVEGENLAGVYTSPYLGNVGSGTIPVICDDFSDNSYLPETWTTYVTSLSTVIASGPLGYLKWNGANSEGTVTVPGFTNPPTSGGAAPYAAWNLSQSQAYTVAAILVLDILNLNDPASPTNPANTNPGAAQQQEDYSFALWELFDPNATADTANRNWGSNVDSVVPWLSGSYASDLNSATKDLESAITASAGGTNASALNGYAVTIYSYVGPPTGTNPSCSGSPCPSSPPQEFIAVTQVTGTHYDPVPEPSSVSVLGVYFLFGGASLLLFGRRRIFRADS